MRRRVIHRKMTGQQYRQWLRSKVRAHWGSRYEGQLISSLRMDELEAAHKAAQHMKAEEAAAVLLPPRDLPPGVVRLEIAEPVLAQDYEPLLAMIDGSRRQAQSIIFATDFPD
jgi:hypothetical protein